MTLDSSKCCFVVESLDYLLFGLFIHLFECCNFLCIVPRNVFIIKKIQIKRAGKLKESGESWFVPEMCSYCGANISVFLYGFKVIFWVKFCTKR